jgi:hypothetical protein
MTNTKPTLRSNYEELSALVSLALENGIITSEKANEYTAFINGRMEQLAKKNAGDRKQTKNQIENEALQTMLVDSMEIGTKYAMSALVKLLPKDSNGEPLSLPKVTALVNPLLVKTAKGEINPNGVLERIVEKGKPYFRKLDLETTEENEENEE